MKEKLKHLQNLVDSTTKQCVIRKKTSDTQGKNNVYTFETVPGRPECGPLTWRETDYCKMIRENQNRRVDEMKLKGLIL